MRQKSTAKASTARRGTVAQADVIIVGGHHTGLSLATVLGARGFNVICLERSPLKARPTRHYDGRTVALSLRTAQILRRAGVWPLIEPQACPIHDIRIADQDSTATLDFDHRDVREGESEPFGWIIENRLFLQALQTRLSQMPQVRVIDGASVAAIETTGAMAAVTLEDGRSFRAPLIVGADGRSSLCRQLAGIETYGWAYEQSAIICNIAHDLPHRHIAVEHFLPGGPFAVLPMTDFGATHRSSIVWTESSAAAAALMDLDDAAFTTMLNAKVALYLGACRMINARQCYPLQLQHAKHYTAPRLVLIGDAAHGIHPIAGQGFNLGMGDIDALADELTRATGLGLDLGNSDLLRRYERRRRIDNGNMVLATDLLDRLFSNALPPVQAVRRLGLGLVQRLPRLKRFFMRTAMGLKASAA